MGIFDIFKSKKKEEKKIKLTVKARGKINSTNETASDETWNDWLKLEGGVFSETKDTFILNTTNNKKYIFKKQCDIKVLQMFNRFLSADLKLMEVFVDDFNPTAILYRKRDVEKRNEFAISSLSGMGNGSWIAFETN